MKKVIIYGSVLMLSGMFLLLMPQQASAQTPAVLDGTPGGETGGDGNGSFGDGPVVPLDGGLSLMLAAAGVGYASNKLKEKKQLLNKV